MALPPPSPAATVTFFEARQQLPAPRDPRGNRPELALMLWGVSLAIRAGRARVAAIHRVLGTGVGWLGAIPPTPVTRCLARAHWPRLLARVDWAALKTLSLTHFGVQVESPAAGEWIAGEGKALRGSPGEQVVWARTPQSGDILASPVKVGIFHDFAGSAEIGAASGVSHEE